MKRLHHAFGKELVLASECQRKMGSVSWHLLAKTCHVVAAVKGTSSSTANGRTQAYRVSYC